jgi:hypothetical protein
VRPYKTGARRSHPDKLARATPAHLHPRIKARLKAGTATLPTSVDLGQYWPSILDQNSTGSCTAHAIACCLTTALAAAGKPLGFVPSPLCTYAATRSLERAAAAPAGSPLPVLTDSGAELADVMTAIAQNGVRPMKAPSPQGFNTDIDTSNVLNESDGYGLEVAAQALITGPYSVDLTQPNFPDVLAAALAENIPIDIAFECDDAFQALSNGGVAVAPVDAPDDGGHSVALTGYQPLTAAQAASVGVAAGTRAFLLTNSWGTGWASSGRVLCAPSFIAALWEAWPTAVN